MTTERQYGFQTAHIAGKGIVQTGALVNLDKDRRPVKERKAHKRRLRAAKSLASKWSNV
jgi:hypothetical protein